METFAPYKKLHGVFIVKNISPSKKVIKIFQYPILWRETRDLLQIPGVNESNIRGSLLKGELQHKIMAKDIEIIYSDIDLLQFNADQRTFLQGAGVSFGLDPGDAIGSGGSGSISFLIKQNQELLGVKNGLNRIFTVPNLDKFISGPYFGNEFKIQVSHNGHMMEQGIDFFISESGGVGTGYDTVIFISFSPKPNSRLIANYVIKN